MGLRYQNSLGPSDIQQTVLNDNNNEEKPPEPKNLVPASPISYTGLQINPF